MSEMTLRHVRVSAVRSSRRIIGPRGEPGRALCGGEITSCDWTLRDAKKSSPADRSKFNLCGTCFDRTQGRKA